jgi:hypothetical protein
MMLAPESPQVLLAQECTCERAQTTSDHQKQLPMSLLAQL